MRALSLIEVVLFVMEWHHTHRTHVNMLEYRTYLDLCVLIGERIV